ncbi:MCM DNA helicase complex subunit [Boothiomyces macroporosus]|uniref:DNA replication licensing factor MCM3 n=1 Tax=Boothiomyces macroporosus TaxID=261099 RepID=A0AAD5UKW7_9FUNG|nr:MCM DNA helicase complex subunit [Boothiomyces macroporosus]
MNYSSTDEIFNERVRVFKEFLSLDHGHNIYMDKIRTMIEKEQKRLIVNLNHLRSYNSEYAQGILDAPIDFLPPFELALKEIVATLQTVALGPGMAPPSYYIGFEGSFGENYISPRNLNSSFLGKTLCLEAIVTRCSLVRPKVSRSVHYCEATKLFLARDYRDGLSVSNDMPTGSVYPKEDDNGNPLETEFGYSTYKDFQMIYVQEMPERALAGQMPRPIDVMLDDDLVDKVKPGDRVTVVGTYRTRGKNAASMSATFGTLFIANNITLLNKEISNPTLTEHDTREIRKIAKRPDAFKLIANSLAPSLFGHEYIKKALLLLMLGGVEKNLENGTHLRGDINILLIGDPSVGKSQMLRFVLNLAPLAIATTGRGSSGVGLTAAVTQDKETGERSLEAGAMVLADRGVVCIDEFDKMSDIDRVAIHEVMEQQTVTIAKAGIHTSLNARCSVLAAANPAFGSYLDEKKPFENITMPDSLLSRFDLVFVVLDKTDDEFNRAISEHITRLHRYVPPGLPEGAPIPESMIHSLKQSKISDDLENEHTTVFEKYNELLHIGVRRPTSRRKKKDDVEILSIPFLKKYLYYAKNRVVPVLTPEAADYISLQYSELRAKIDGTEDKYRTMPITPRTLETLIRLATAHAKCRLSKQVEQVDAEVAYEILVFALFKEVKPKRREKKQKVGDGSDSDSDDGTIYERQSLVSRSTNSRATKPSLVVSSHSKESSRHLSSLIDPDISDVTSSVPKNVTEQEEMAVDPDSYQTAIPSRDRIDLFRKQLNAIRSHFNNLGRESITFDEIMERVNVNNNEEMFSPEQVESLITDMSEQNMGVWYMPENGTVMFI